MIAFFLYFERIGKRMNNTIEITVRGAKGTQSLNIPKKTSLYVLKGFFDGSFSNFRRFPEDASMYLFLWDPKSPREKGMDIPIE